MIVCWVEIKEALRPAKERMKLVLVHDRTDMPAAEMDQLKDELIDVISRHVEIERGGGADRDDAGWARAAPASPTSRCAPCKRRRTG